MNDIAWHTTVSMGILMAMGFTLRKMNWVSDHFTDEFSRMLYYSIIPCTILNSTMNMEFSAEQVKNGGIMLALSVLFIVAMVAIGQVLYLMQGKGRRGCLMRFSMFYTNFTIMGLSLAQLLFGAEGLFYFSLLLVPLRVYSYSTADWMLNGKARKKGEPYNWKGLFSPLLVYTIAGMVIYLVRLPVPGVVRDTIATASSSMTTCGMILCGLLLARARIGDQLRSAQLYIFLACKLFLSPLLMMALLWLLGVHGLPAHLCVMLSSLPVAAAVGTFAVKNNCAPEYAAVYIATSTVGSVFTIPLMIQLATMVL